jgi:hypothetical protein
MNKMTVLTVDQCQSLDTAVRTDLELFDYEVRHAFTRLLTQVDQSGEDGLLFLKASTIVLLSIAAGLLARSAEEIDPLQTESFVTAAESAWQWAQLRKLRYFSEGEA